MSGILIKNGTVITGSGEPGFKADVLIRGDRIAAVENAGDTKNFRVIDATGKVVCPGIIDSHSHADLSIYRADHRQTLEPLIRQGITTFIGGNCGMALAPLNGDNYELKKMYIEGFTARTLDDEVKWSGMDGFLDFLEQEGVALNCAMLAPHGIIRIGAMGMDARYATNDEIKSMCRSVEECMDAGCIGLSTGLQYMPGLQSDTRELVWLGGVLKKYDGIYTSHLRTYMNELPRAIDELTTVVSANDIRGQVSHIFWVPDMGPAGPAIRMVARELIKLSKKWTLPMKMDTEIEHQIARLSALKRKGISVGMDVMPTTTSFTHLLAYFPPWVVQGDKDAIGKRFTDPKIRKKIRDDIENGKMDWPHTGSNRWSLNIFRLLGWESTRIMSVVTPQNKPLEGQSIAEIAKKRGKHPFDTACDLLWEEEARILVFSSLGEPEDNFTEQTMYAPLKSPDVCISTDTILMGFGKPSHLFHGAYPKFLSRYVREMKMLDLETAVRKCTGLPAEHFGLKSRGFIRKGYYADVLVFDPRTIAPNCNFHNPRGIPSGIEHVFINGRHVLDRGVLNLKKLPGRVLRRA